MLDFTTCHKMSLNVMIGHKPSISNDFGCVIFTMGKAIGRQT